LLADRLSPYLSDSGLEARYRIKIRKSGPRTWSRADAIPKSLKWVRSRPMWGDFRDGALRLTDGVSFAAVRYDERIAAFELADETLKDAHFSARTFLLLPIVELLRLSGMFYLHGAFISREDRAFLILGEGGAGKSTLAAALSAAGWKLVGDDNLLLRLDARGACRIFPLEQELSVTREVFGLLGISGSFPSERNKVRIPLKALGERSEPFAVPTDIRVLTKSDAARPALTPSVLFDMIVRENPLILAIPDLAPAHTEAVRRLLRQTKHERAALPRPDPMDLTALARAFGRFPGAAQ
jgi:hypothetical protein